MSKKSLNSRNIFKFPCQFPIKIIANYQKKAVNFIIEILKNYVDNPNDISFEMRKSKNSRYISITATFEAKSQSQLNNIYSSLGKYSEIHMVL